MSIKNDPERKKKDTSRDITWRAVPLATTLAFHLACTWKFALKYKVKQSKNGKFTSNYETNPIGFETQIPLRR